jgi:hypothetical protein
MSYGRSETIEQLIHVLLANAAVQTLAMLYSTKENMWTVHLTLSCGCMFPIGLLVGADCGEEVLWTTRVLLVLAAGHICELMEDQIPVIQWPGSRANRLSKFLYGK